MLDVLYAAVQAIGLAGLAYGAWLVYSNRDLWLDRERDRRRHPRDPDETIWNQKRRTAWRSRSA